MNIYQQIWNADQEGNGIQPILKYVVVNEVKEENPDHSLFGKVLIPDPKVETYELCKNLFNNYNLAPSQGEHNTLEEDEEVHLLLETIIESRPMTLARNFVASQTNEVFSLSRWYKTLMDVWFTQFTQSSGKDLSAFEHIIVGEQKGGTVSGYHFWYKYWLDDTNNLLGKDDIKYLGTRGENQEENLLVPEVSTLSYKWDAYDYNAETRRPLFKKIGGFFNGCSIEGLMALGTVRFLPRARSPKEAVINRALYNMKLYRSSNGKHMRTFYPVFVQISEPEKPTGPTIEPTEEKNALRITAALVNPPGHDPGLEKIYLMNLSPQKIDLTGYAIEDKNGNRYQLENIEIDGGTVEALVIPPNTAQLSNKGGIIKFFNQNKILLQSVSYSKVQAKKEGWLIDF